MKRAKDSIHALHSFRASSFFAVTLVVAMLLFSPDWATRAAAAGPISECPLTPSNFKKLFQEPSQLKKSNPQLFKKWEASQDQLIKLEDKLALADVNKANKSALLKENNDALQSISQNLKELGVKSEVKNGALTFDLNTTVNTKGLERVKKIIGKDQSFKIEFSPYNNWERSTLGAYNSVENKITLGDSSHLEDLLWRLAKNKSTTLDHELSHYLFSKKAQLGGEAGAFDVHFTSPNDSRRVQYYADGPYKRSMSAQESYTWSMDLPRGFERGQNPEQLKYTLEKYFKGKSGNSSLFENTKTTLIESNKRAKDYLEIIDSMKSSSGKGKWKFNPDKNEFTIEGDSGEKATFYIDPKTQASLFQKTGLSKSDFSPLKTIFNQNKLASKQNEILTIFEKRLQGLEAANTQTIKNIDTATEKFKSLHSKVNGLNYKEVEKHAYQVLRDLREPMRIESSVKLSTAYKEGLIKRKPSTLDSPIPDFNVKGKYISTAPEQTKKSVSPVSDPLQPQVITLSDDELITLALDKQQREIAFLLKDVPAQEQFSVKSKLEKIYDTALSNNLGNLDAIDWPTLQLEARTALQTELQAELQSAEALKPAPIKEEPTGSKSIISKSDSKSSDASVTSNPKNYHYHKYEHMNERTLSLSQRPVATESWLGKSHLKESLLKLDQETGLFSDISKNYHEVHNKFLTKAELLEYAEGRVQLYEDFLNQLRNSPEAATHPALKEISGKWLSRLQHDIKPKLNPLRAQTDLQILNSDEFMNNLRGLLGEMHSTLTRKNVTNASFKIFEVPELRTRLDSRIAELRNEFPAQTDPLAFFESQHFKIPNINEYNIAEYNSLSHHDRVDFVVRNVRKWMTDKEFDVLTKEGAVYKIGEVKANLTPLHEDGFMTNKYKADKKSYYDQIMENQNIIKFLKLESSYRVEYIPYGGVDQSVKNILEKSGIQVQNH